MSRPPGERRGALPLVEMRGITKRFGTVVANEDISLAIWSAEIQTVLGENGAGKTTLMNILSGLERPDAGRIWIMGRETHLLSPRDAFRLGIGTVYQHFTLVSNLSVVENIILGATTGLTVNLADAERHLQQLLKDFDLATSARTEVRHLSFGEQQRVEIVKALHRGSRLLLLDEPTTGLTPGEVDNLFAVLRRVKADGVAIVLITHKLEEALAISDRIVILRRGKRVGEVNPEELVGRARAELKHRIVQLMFPTSVVREVERADHVVNREQRILARQPLLRLEDVSVNGDAGGRAVRDVSLDIVKGEIFGIVGIDGNGQKELAEAVAGQRHVVRGRVVLEGVNLTNRGVAAAAGAGIGYLTDNRLGEGCVPSASVAANLVAKVIGRPPFSRHGLLNRLAIETHARVLIDRFEIRTPSPWTRTAFLSGGNIQKLLLARELAGNPKLLICHKPTSGLDAQTAAFVLQTLRQNAAAGVSILLISSELDELLEMSDRIAVVYGGRLLATVAREDASAEGIGRLMLGLGAAA